MTNRDCLAIYGVSSHAIKLENKFCSCLWQGKLKMNPASKQPPLITAMLNPGIYDHPADNLQLIETHISWVILAGQYAYKLKKPVNLGFLDFSTLEKRRFYCEEELRLNHRLAPSLYLQVVAITGLPEQPCLNGPGEPIDFAVKMNQFPRDAQLDRMLNRGELLPEHIDGMACFVADFHRHTVMADPETTYGDPEHIDMPVTENFSQIRDRITNSSYLKTLETLQQWTKTEFDKLLPILRLRKAKGYIRECHGDLHLRNLAWVNQKPLAFDCIEFNPNFRWIDVISEIAFLVMDLEDRGQPLFAQRFLNRYLEQSGDYAGIQILRFYLVYRALVRAKVDAIRCSQDGIGKQEQKEAEEDFSGYLRLAENYTHTSLPRLIITHGPSGSGKTTLTQPLLEKLGAIRLRSDVERKHLFGLKADGRAQAKPGKGIYTTDSTEKTYQKLAELASTILDAGYSVIIDATCQKPAQRALFQQLASQKQLPYVILEFTASADALRSRITKRMGGASDADLRVLDYQLSHWHPLQKNETEFTISIDTESRFDVASVSAQIKSLQ